MRRAMKELWKSASERKGETRLYNVIFPIWMLILFPYAWIVVLPLNFLIDFLVVRLSFRKASVEDAGKKTWRTILRVWLCGFAADLLGAALMLTSDYIGLGEKSAFDIWWNEHVAHAAMADPFSEIYGFLYVSLCVAITGALIYLANRYFCLNRAGLTRQQRKKTALHLALFTAPYLFFLPIEWFY